MTRKIMVDLETLGTQPGSVILSIGAVEFDIDKGLGETFYAVISHASSRQAGLTEDANTLAWWAKQSDAAREILRHVDDANAPTLRTALHEFGEFLKRDDEVWGNGSDFDNVLLASAYEAVGIPLPWKFWNNRCYRTLKNLRPDIRLERVGTHHNALDDAKTQAIHAIQLLRALVPGNQ